MANHASIPAQARRAGSFHVPSWGAPLLLGLFCFLVYNANLRQIGAGDTIPARYIPLLIWKNKTLALDLDKKLVAEGHSLVPAYNRPTATANKDNRISYREPWTYWLVPTRDHQLASLYPVVAPLLVSPLYLPAVAWLDVHGWEQPQVERIAERMEKLSASLLASIASVLMYLVLRRDCGRWSLPIALTFAFGTNTWMISSQALWQHGAGELFIAAALLLVLSAPTPFRIALLGTFCVLMAANRPPDGLIAAALGCHTLWKQRGKALWLAAGAIPPLAALLWYNLAFIGHYAGGYGLAQNANSHFFQLDWTGLPGLLISPARGLLVFCPFFVFILAGFSQRFRSPETKSLAVCLGFAVVAQLLLYSQGDWRAGSSWGPRWLTDLLPILMWMLAPAPFVLRPAARFALVLAMVASVVIQAIGAFWYTRKSDELLFAAGSSPMAAAWKISNLPFLVELGHPPAPGDLWRNAAGGFDRVGTTEVPGHGDIPRLESGMLVEGWALSGERPPSEFLLLIDGVIVGQGRDYHPRTGMGNQQPSRTPTGWSTPVDLRAVPSGPRVLQFAIRLEPASNLRIVSEQPVLVPEQKPPVTRALPELPPLPRASLDTLAARAASRLREHQDKNGYWLTTYTPSLHYESPEPEMNTFLTATMVDFLSPIAGRHGLYDVIQSARTHLAAQIEPDGLVRYHGLPDAPTIKTLGRIITPDSDDTALAWRISAYGADDRRLKPMLKKLEEYRDARGLYYTWLAPVKDYVSLNPGFDPNPSDIGIQLNVYLMLHEIDPVEARALGDAIVRSWDDGDIWVYYAKAPLLPYLRSAQVQQLGCPIPLPSERLSLPLAQQRIWSEVAYWLVQPDKSFEDPRAKEEVLSLLSRLGQDDFNPVRSMPPLLYHNDLTASLPRYYWSEDFGYVLWLQLYGKAHAPGGKSRLSP